MENFSAPSIITLKYNLINIFLFSGVGNPESGIRGFVLYIAPRLIAVHAGVSPPILFILYDLYAGRGYH